MIRLLKDQAFVPGKNYIEAAGLSTDQKPTSGIITGSRFLEVDTGDIYEFDEVSGTWSKVEDFDGDITAAVDAWLDAHPEATTTVEDGAISYAKLDSELKATADEVPELKSALNQQTIFADKVFENGSAVYDLTYTNNAVNSTTGQQSDASPKRASTPGVYFFPVSCELHASDLTSFGIMVLCFDETGTYLGYKTRSAVVDGIVPVYSGTRYIRFAVWNWDDTNISTAEAKAAVTFTCVYNGRVQALSDDVETVENDIDALENKVSMIAENNNLLNGFTPKDGFYDGSQHSSNDYKYFERIPVEDDKTYKIYPRSRMVYIYNASGTLINYLNQNNITEITAEGDGFAYVTYYTADNLNEALFYENGADNVCPRGYYVLSDSIIQINNLTGKKWAVLGDSFTAGADSGTIQDGTYAGQKIVYPYLIGNRTGINVLSFFAGGRTLAYPAVPGDFVNSVTCPGKSYYYQNIPADVDYVTIYLGINDHHHLTGGGDGEDPTGLIDLGTIDDNTTATYYGAWNVVMSWLIANRPNAHIGIIVSNGITSSASQEAAHPTAEQSLWRKAQIDIAEKYGIPYIDLNGDSRTKAMIRTSNPNIPAAIKQTMIENWAVDYAGGNWHPNNNAHEFESYFIENFLRSL